MRACLIGVVRCSGFTGHAGTAGREVEGGAAHGRARGHIYARIVPLTSEPASLSSLLRRARTREDEDGDEDDRGWTRGRDPLPTSGRLALLRSRPVASSLLSPSRSSPPERHGLSLSLSFSRGQRFPRGGPLFVGCAVLAHSLSRSRARHEKATATATATTTVAAAFLCRTAAPESPARRVTAYNALYGDSSAISPGALTPRAGKIRTRHREIVSSERASDRDSRLRGGRVTARHRTPLHGTVRHGTVRHGTARIHGNHGPLRSLSSRGRDKR